jgi:hypothetical protein
MRRRPLPASQSLHQFASDTLSEFRACKSRLARRVLSAKQAAEYLGLEHGNLAKRRCYGGGPAFVRLGRRIVYDIADLNKWMDGNRHESTSQYDAAGAEAQKTQVAAKTPPSRAPKPRPQAAPRRPIHSFMRP